MPTTQDVTDWQGQKVVGNGDEKLGTISDIYLDEETGQPEWLAVSTGLFGTKVSFVPLADAVREGDHIRVPSSVDAQRVERHRKAGASVGSVAADDKRPRSRR